MSSKLDGWLVAKKNPKEIARDRKKALEKKRQMNNKNQKSFRGKSSRPKKKPSYEEDSDFSGDDDNFIVDDDEDVEIIESEDEAFDSNLEDEEEEDEEEMILHDDDDEDDGIEHDTKESRHFASSRSSRASARGGTKTDALLIDSDSDSDDEESFLPTGNVRRSAPSKLLQRNAEVAKNTRIPSLEASMPNAEKKKRKKSIESSLMQLKKPALKKSKTKSKSSIVAKRESLGDDDEEVTSPHYTPKKPMHGGKSVNPKPENSYQEVFSSDEENTINHSITNSKKPRVPLNGETSRFFGGKNKKAIVLHGSDSDSSDDNKLLKSKFNNANKSNAFEDTPDPSNQDRRRRLNKKVSKMNGIGVSNEKTSRIAYSIDDSSDEDEMVNVDDSNVNDAGFGDEDIRVAMKLSLMESKKQKANGATEPIKKKEEDKNIELLLEDSSDEEDGDQGEEYYDEEKETASNVLRSAEQLSGHVVRAMSKWFGDDDGSGVVQGIIVDGALALGNIDEAKSGNHTESPRNGDNNDTHKWISKAVMSKAIPNVKLSSYQLIGVNWMALLNGMTCEVGTKGTKNVNGVLADEMGLVCISPTTAMKCSTDKMVIERAHLRIHKTPNLTEHSDFYL